MTEINLHLSWSENCVITSKATRDANPNADPAIPEINAPTNATFKIKDAKLYVTVNALSKQDYNKFLEQLKTGFKRSEMNKQTKTNHLNYLIDPTFNKVNRLIVLSFENEDDKTSFSKYYTPRVEIKDFNVLIDGKSFFDVPVKSNEET